MAIRGGLMVDAYTLPRSSVILVAARKSNPINPVALHDVKQSNNACSL